MEKIYLIHGDLTFIRVDSIPTAANRIPFKSGFVLEHGESGHTHTIESECEIYEDNGSMFLKVSHPIQINHEEHGLQTLEPGIYRKDLEQEFDYEAMEARNTRD